MIQIHDRVLTFETPDDRIFSLAHPSIGNGPFHIRLAVPFRRGQVKRESICHWSQGRLRIGSLEVRLAGCDVWNPSPTWGDIELSTSLLHALDAIFQEMDSNNLDPIDRDLFEAVGGEATRQGDGDALDALREGLQHADPGRLGDAGEWLLGRGGGLTPAGDDLLLGAEVALWLQCPQTAQSLCSALIAGADHRTTTLSCAFLKSAAQGELREAWHILLEEKSHSLPILHQHLKRIISYGATSGQFALIGFRLALEALGGFASR